MKAHDPTLAAFAALLPTLQDAAMRRRIELAIATPPADEMPAALSNRVLSASETARVFSVTPKTIHRMAADGTLHRVKLPGRVRGCGFLQSEVVALLLKCAVGEAV